MKKKLICLLGVLACLSLTACGSGSTDQTAETEEPQNTAAEEEQETEAPEEAEEEQEETSEEQEESVEDNGTVYVVGDNAELGDWNINVTDAQIVESIAGDYGSFSPDTDGSKYVHVFLTVTNNGKETDRFLPSFGYGDDVYVKMLYGDGYEFSAVNLLGYSKDMHDSTINPLTSADGEIAFEIPQSVAEATDELLVSFFSGNDSVVFQVR